MIVEIYGAKFVNKGAELMLLSIIEKVKDRYPDAKIVLSCSSRKEWSLLDKKGFFKKLTYRKGEFIIPDLGIFVPKFLRKKYGIIIDRDIDVVYEASGFAYGDQWTPRMALIFGKLLKIWTKQKRKIIFMPQAFGPFRKSLNRRYTKAMLEFADLVFVRDRISMDAVNELLLKDVKVEQKPDFTILLKGKILDKYKYLDGYICLIPNNKIIETSQDGSKKQEYLDFFSRTISYMRDKGQKCLVLNHEGQKDYNLCLEIKENNPDVEVVWEKDPLAIKGIISLSKVVIGSRFHGLVSALSQGIPALAIGWSHKYEMLFEDFGFADGLINVSDAEGTQQKLEQLMTPNNYIEIKNKIVDSGSVLKQYSNDMWDKIYNLTDGVNN